MAASNSLPLSMPWGKQVGSTVGSTFGAKSNSGIGGVYSGAVHQQAGDYDNIMKKYQEMYSGGGGAGGAGNQPYSPINAQKVGYNAIPRYQQSGQLQGLYGQLGGMSQTGGYSESDLGSMRERGIAPTRAIYANALRNMQRQRSIQGGYSPNFGALQAKMAREQAGIIGDQTNRVNADIAEKVAQGKQFALGQMSPIAQQGDRFNTDINTKNALEKQRVAELNAKNKTDVDMFNRNALLNYQQQLANQQGQALQGMQSMYSATPALVNTFGQQALQSSGQNLQGQQAVSQAKQQRANTGLQAISQVAQAPRPASQPIQFKDPFANQGSHQLYKGHTVYTNPQGQQTVAGSRRY